MTVFEMITDNDIIMLFGMITGVAAIAVICVELISFIPELMLSVLNRMRNKSLSNDHDILTSSLEYKDSLDPKNMVSTMDAQLDKSEALTKTDLFKRFAKR